MTDRFRFNVGDRVHARQEALNPHRDGGDPTECGCGGGVVGFVTAFTHGFVLVRVYLDTLGEFDRGEDLPYLARELEHID